MMAKPRGVLLLLTFLGILFFQLLLPSRVCAQTPTAPIVHAVLFYQSTCGHCQQLIEEALPPLFQKYGNQLQIFGIDTHSPEGDMLFRNAIKHFSIQRIGVPTLIVGEQPLVGVEIQQQFPAMIEDLLKQGGIGWPEFPGLAEALASAQANPVPSPVPELQAGTAILYPQPTLAPSPTPTPGLLLTKPYPDTLGERLKRDLLGNIMAILVLGGMVAAFILGGVNFFLKPVQPNKQTLSKVIPLLCGIGLGVAAYLSYVELLQAEAICGPVGDCNAVQQSKYARLFGVLPIGVLGMAGYLAVAVMWFISRLSRGQAADYARLAAAALTAFGTLFSIYLTFLEPFVIGATCAWCLASAVIMTGLFLLSIGPGKYSLQRLKASLEVSEPAD